MEEDNKKIPRKLFDFCNENPKLSNPKRRKKLSKCYRKAEAKHHLKTFIRLYLESIDGNSIDLSKIVAFANAVLLEEVESEHICYLKRMPNGKTRIFKKFYCCIGLKAWKDCPEYSCLAWPCDESWTCPYEDEKPISLKLGADISFKNNKQGKHSGADKKESSK